MNIFVCPFCGERVTPGSRGVRQLVSAWENAVTREPIEVEPLGEYAHARCVAEREIAANPDPPPDLLSARDH